jgi:hypothetical protein
MKKSINDNRKKPGRPATGTAPLVGVRMSKELQARIKSWARKQEDAPPLATAIRQLVNAALKPHAFCLSVERAAEISAWAKENGLSLHEAIAKLIEFGLKANGNSA